MVRSTGNLSSNNKLWFGIIMIISSTCLRSMIKWHQVVSVAILAGVKPGLHSVRRTYATEMRKRIYASHARRGVYTPRVDLGAYTQTSCVYA